MANKAMGKILKVDFLYKRITNKPKIGNSTVIKSKRKLFPLIFIIRVPATLKIGRQTQIKICDRTKKDKLEYISPLLRAILDCFSRTYSIKHDKMTNMFKLKINTVVDKGFESPKIGNNIFSNKP
jgi:hypothetical protein